MADIMTQEEIDNFIRAEINRLGPKGKGHPRTREGNKWREEPLMLRRQTILRMLGEGKTKWTIILDLSNRWGVAKNTVRIYVTDAYQFISDNYKEDYDTLKEVLIHRLESMVEESIESRDRKSALKAYEMIAKLGGLVDDKIRLEGETTIKFDFGNAE
jgi:fumarylacetoacetate (FAA) hydrolase family protein